MLRAKELLGAVNGHLFRLIYELTAAVIPLARKTLGILVGHHVRHGFGDRGTHIVLGGDELDTLKLTQFFPLDDLGDLWIGGFQVTHVHKNP